MVSQKTLLPNEFAELEVSITSLPVHHKSKLLPLLEKVKQFVQLQNKLIRAAQDAVDQFQLDIKYLLFDVEATRRERDDLSALVDFYEHDEYEAGDDDNEEE